MSEPVYRICNLLEKTLQGVPLGTNLGLFQLQFALVSGRFLESRGAVFPALDDLGLEADAVRRSSAALRQGQWKTQDLLDNWQKIVRSEGHFTPHCHGGYRPVPCDLTGFRRPELKGNSAKHYVAEANKALPAIVIGMAGAVGSVTGAVGSVTGAVGSVTGAVGSVTDSCNDGNSSQAAGSKHRFLLPRLLVRWEPGDTREADVQTRLIEQVGKTLAPEEVAVFDAGFSLAEVRTKTPRFVIRLAKNATLRRNYLPEYKGCGRRSEYGEVVRPLARTHAGKQIEATACDATFGWEDDGICLRAKIWSEVVLSEEKVSATTVNVVAVYDPRYKEPWLLATSLEVTAEVVWRLYRDRWAVEHLPLVAKPMLGCGQAFVFGKESRLRLPELALLSGNMLSYVAATCSAVVTGFWDRVCRATCGRLRRVLNRLDFSELPVLGGQLRKKASMTSHLVKGVEGHRRQKSPKAGQGVLQNA